MKRVSKVLIFALILCMSIPNMVFAGESVRSSVVSQRGELKYDEIYYKVAKRVYDNYQRGITKTVIGLKGVEFEARQSNGVNPTGSILMKLELGIKKMDALVIGDVTKVTIEARKASIYDNSSVLDTALEKLVDSANNKSSIKDKLGYINDKVGRETAYSMGNTAEDVLVNGTGQCGGFSNTVSEVCEDLGIKEVPMAITGGGHEANLVYIGGDWKLWDLTWNQGTNGDVETVYYAEPTADGEVEFVTGPRNRQYFLIDLQSDQGERYIADSGINKYDIGLAEALISIKYPSLGNIDLDLGSVEVDATSLEEPKKEVPVNNGNTGNTTGSTGGNTNGNTNVPVYPPVGKIVIDGQGNVISDTINNPQTPVNPPAKNVKALPTSSNVMVDGKKVAFEAYNINGHNYFKLRDLAMVVNGTKKQFIVGWDGANNAISIIPRGSYTPAGGELEVSKNPSTKDGTLTTSKIFLSGQEVKFEAYNIEGHNYFKLRDVGKAINFGVGWDGTTNTIKIDTEVGYTE